MCSKKRGIGFSSAGKREVKGVEIELESTHVEPHIFIGCGAFAHKFFRWGVSLAIVIVGHIKMSCLEISLYEFKINFLYHFIVNTLWNFIDVSVL